jgi:hypothetical protein
MPAAPANSPKVGAASATGVRGNTTPGVDNEARPHSQELLGQAK